MSTNTLSNAFLGLGPLFFCLRTFVSEISQTFLSFIVNQDLNLINRVLVLFRSIYYFKISLMNALEKKMRL